MSEQLVGRALEWAAQYKGKQTMRGQFKPAQGAPFVAIESHDSKANTLHPGTIETYAGGAWVTTRHRQAVRRALTPDQLTQATAKTYYAAMLRDTLPFFRFPAWDGYEKGRTTANLPEWAEAASMRMPAWNGTQAKARAQAHVIVPDVPFFLRHPMSLETWQRTAPWHGVRPTRKAQETPTFGFVELPKGDKLPQGVLDAIKAKVGAFDVALKAQGVANAARRCMCKDLFASLRAQAERQARFERIKRRAKKAGETRTAKAQGQCRAKGEHGTNAPLTAFAPAKGPHHKPRKVKTTAPAVKVRKKSS